MHFKKQVGLDVNQSVTKGDEEDHYSLIGNIRVNYTDGAVTPVLN